MSGATFSAIGVVVILSLRLPAAVVIAASVVWLTLCAWELWQIRRGFLCCLRLRVSADGGIFMLDVDGEWQAAKLLPGSVVLRRVAWIRVATRQGLRVTEPFRGSCRESDEWRRLQVIWRHIGATR